VPSSHISLSASDTRHMAGPSPPGLAAWLHPGAATAASNAHAPNAKRARCLAKFRVGRTIGSPLDVSQIARVGALG
jgi:hypothetical protein